jgi:Berberine and berberine like
VPLLRPDVAFVDGNPLLLSVEGEARYDPDNLFHLNQNIPSTTADPDDQNDPRTAA